MDQFTGIVARSLAEAPGDGFVLREFVLRWRDDGRTSEMLDTLDRGSLETLALGLAEVAYVRGLALFYLDHYESALASLSEAAERRPGWNWPVFYSVRILQSQFRPEAEYRRGFDAALADPDTRAAVLIHKVWRLHDLNERTRLLEDLAMLRTDRWVACVYDVLAFLYDAREPRRGAYERAIDRLRQAHGALIEDTAHALATRISVQLPPRDALAILESQAKRPHAGQGWSVERAELLWRIGHVDRALEVLDALPSKSLPAYDLWLQIAEYILSASDLLQQIEQRSRPGLEDTIVEREARILSELGRKSEADALLALRAKENPAALIWNRFSELTYADVQAASALTDSLQAAGVDSSLIEQQRTWLRRQTGDLSLLDLETTIEKQSLAFYVIGLALAHIHDAERGLELSRRFIELAPHDTAQLLDLLNAALARNRLDIAAEIRARLLEDCADCPLVAEANMRFLLVSGDERSANAELDRVMSRADLTPYFCITLVPLATALNRVDDAERLVNRAYEKRPGWQLAQASKARFLIDGGRLREAGEIVDRLMQQFPARKSYQDLQFSVGVTLTEVMEQDEGWRTAQFESFNHDLQSTDWIAERRATLDTTGAIARYLLEQYSYVLRDDGDFAQRERRVIEILSDEGLSEFGVQTIDFRPDLGTPQILLARVVHPDGSVQETPHDDVVVSGVDGGGIDVDDVRRLSLPFRNLRVGSVVDFVYELGYTPLLANSWSFRHDFVTGLPAIESVLEVRLPKDFPVRLYERHGPPDKNEWSDGPYRFVRWTLKNNQPQAFAALEPDFYDRIPWVGFSTHASWAEAGVEYGEFFWPKVAIGSDLRSEVRRQVRGAGSTTEKLQRVYDYVTSRTRYVAIELGQGALVPTPAETVLRRGYGDCKDMAALMIGMLEAVDVEAHPALVHPRPHSLTVPEFVEPSNFSHMIVRVLDRDRELYSDPTSGQGCADHLDPSLEGMYTLVVPRDGDAELRRIPIHPSQHHGFTMQMDVYPAADEVRLEVDATYRGHLGDRLRTLLRGAADNDRLNVIDRMVGYGAWEGCTRTDYAVEELGCGRLRLTATYVDSSSTNKSRKRLPLRLNTEVADPLFDYPSPDDERTTPVRINHAFADTAVIRVHEGEDWTVDGRIAPITISADSYRGRIASSWIDTDDGRALQIIQTFALDDPEFLSHEYEPFYMDWIRFRVGVMQTYSLRRVLDQERVQRYRNYVAQYPDDVAFALRAADDILGDDLGGLGADGRERRDIAREFLKGFLGSAETMPLVIYAITETRDGRYLRADSILTVAYERSPDDLMVLYMAVFVKSELEDRDAQIELLRRILRRTGDSNVQLDLIRALYASGRFDDAAKAEARYFALNADADSTDILYARLAGHEAADRCKESTETLRLLESRIDEDDARQARVAYFNACDAYEESTKLLEELWADSPFDAKTSNNLAWSYAILGQQLERAEELSRAAIMLSDDPTASRNTRGAILARQGRWDEARALFVEARDTDDRPRHWSVNEYFVGLCDYELGRREEAIQRWQTALRITTSSAWRQKIERSLELARTGGDVTQPVFSTASGNGSEAATR